MNLEKTYDEFNEGLDMELTTSQLTDESNEGLGMEVNTKQLISENDMKELCIKVALEFKQMYANFDFSYELGVMQIKYLQRSLRKLLIKEFQCFYIALWDLALQSSFPNNHEEIFDLFMSDFALKDKMRDSKIEHITLFIEKLKSQSDNSFSHIGLYFLSFTTYQDDVLPSMTRKLALHFRKMYTFIFERLY